MKNIVKVGLVTAAAAGAACLVIDKKQTNLNIKAVEVSAIPLGLTIASVGGLWEKSKVFAVVVGALGGWATFAFYELTRAYWNTFK